MKLKKVIIIMLVFILIFSLSIVVILVNNRNKQTVEGETDRSEPQTEFDSTIQRVSIRNNFYMIKNAVDKFYGNYIGMYNSLDDITEMGEISKEEQEKECKEAVYSILDEEYRNYKNITLDNLQSKLSKVPTLEITITDMYESQKDENIYAYFVYGYTRNKETLQISDFSILVKADLKNRTYKVLLQDYVENKYKDIQLGDNIKIALPTEIESNEYNKMNFRAISDARYVTDIINNYKENMLYNIEEAYENLDSEYKEKRFNTIEEFKKYVSERKETIKSTNVEKFQKQKYEDYNQFICVDNEGKQLIIKEIAPMKYTLLLDTYTINFPQFIEKYESVNEKNKVALNMEKIKEAINDGNYKYVYEKLNETFRNKNFQSYNNFVANFSQKFFKDNTFEYKSVEKKDNVYYITILIKNNDSKEEKSEKFVMRLLENTDFEISYNI